MKRNVGIVVLLAVGIGLGFAVPTAARMGVDGPNGFRIDMDASVEPGGDYVPSAISGSAGRLHRFVLNEGQQRYFAYDLVMVASGSDSLRIRVEPLSTSPSELAKLPMIERSWAAVPLLKPPLAQEVKAGSKLVIDLVQNPTRGRRVVDTVVFTRPGAKPASTTAP